MKTIKDVYYSGTQDTARSLDVYLPDGECTAVFMYMHGGGLEKGDKARGADTVAEYLTARSIGYVSINYRMYPEASYPEFIYDAADAVSWTKTYMRDELGCGKLYVGGSSAGGYLSMMLCFDPRYLARVGLDNDGIAGYLHDAGQPTAHFKVLEMGGTDRRRVIVDETAPLYYVGLAESYPPMRFIVSDNDMQNRYEQTMLMLSTLKHFGHKKFDHVVMHGKHCEYVRKLTADGTSVLGQMIYDFITSVEK